MLRKAPWPAGALICYREAADPAQPRSALVRVAE